MGQAVGQKYGVQKMIYFFCIANTLIILFYTRKKVGQIHMSMLY